MPRPLRIEYEHAFYHVMNQGRARSPVFHDDVYYQSFLNILGETCLQYGCIVHVYCLIGSHYHILIETPKANLSRIMQHINSVYTQWYNRLRKADGPLFKGRFKAVLVEHNDYLLQLSRYIHRNPIDIKNPLVTQLSNYRWSSYSAYVGDIKPVDWLTQDLIFSKLGYKDKHHRYANYVMSGVDEETARFYSKGQLSSIMRGEQFRKNVKGELNV